ncbi:hypothetical protein [Arthrobacter sp. W4I7]|uniref:hypothetical protein n=1 Tax=Arthrobacter sp. W4I7 TaxID=3042296 RepID=UPI00278B2778|nr:hypothetical protein [Arthrobacter sp. W4I7]MDQ0690010.1 hypothetical protein [Arthrobacter sp. W4I7]
MTAIQEYRLRVFELAAIEPHIRFFTENPGLASSMRAWFEEWAVFDWSVEDRAWQIRGGTAEQGDDGITPPPGGAGLFELRTSSPSDIGLLHLCLLSEAKDWVIVGGQLGYFPTEAAPETDIEGLGAVEAYKGKLQSYYMGVTDFEAQNDPGFDDGDAFGVALQEMIEDLTDDRMEYLTLVMFAPRYIWTTRIGQVKKLAATVAARPDAALPPEVMENVAWVFLGPPEERFSRIQPESKWPSAWRMELPSSEAYGLGVGQQAEGQGLAFQRLKEVHECRRQLEIAAQQISVDENATLALQQRDALNRLIVAIQKNAPEGLVAAEPENGAILFGWPSEAKREAGSTGKAIGAVPPASVAKPKEETAGDDEHWL